MIDDDTQPDDDAKESSAKREKEVLEEACERFERAYDDDQENRDAHREDYNFVYSQGSQYDADTRRRRTNWKLPCLEFNQLPQFVHQTVNDQRQNRPGIRIHPAAGNASDEVADIYQGMIRAIEYDSQAEAVYDTGFEGAVVGGRGWWRIATEYEGNTFNQKIVIKAIKDGTTVVADMQYEQPDGGDRRFAFVLETIPKEEFTRRWPKADPVDWDDIDARWRGDDDIVIADYYRRVATRRTLVMMSDGAIGWLDEMPTPPEGVREVARREADDFTVEWFKIAGGQQILEEYDCPGDVIPVICTPGTEALIDGKRIFQGLIRNARDPQRMLNYGMTQQAVHLALTPQSPWIVAAGQVDQFKDLWKNANNEYYAFLPYTPMSVDGVVVPAPQRTAPSSPDAGWLNWTQQQVGMIKSTIGMYENSLGIRGNEQSGRAIIAREKQGDNATFHFADNLARAIGLTGRIIVKWIPTYYDMARIVHIVAIDGTRSKVQINQPSLAPDEQGALQAIKLNDVTTGEYAVTVESGPSYATKRQESAEKLSQMVQAFPQLMQVAGDLVIKAQDFPDAEAMADRAKLGLLPAVQQSIAAQEKGGKPPDPQMLAAMAQKDQQMQAMQQALQQAGHELQQLKSGAQEKMMTAQIDAQLQREKMQADAQAAIAKAQADAQLSIEKARIDGEVALQKAQIEQATAIRKAVIERATALEVAQIGAQVDLATIAADTQREVMRAEAEERRTEADITAAEHTEK